VPLSILRWLPLVVLMVGAPAVAQPPEPGWGSGWVRQLPRVRHLEGLRSESPEVRIEAARGLRAAEPTAPMLRALREALETTNAPRALGEIAATLAWHGDRGATGTLVAAFEGAPPQAAAGLARALGSLATPPALGALVAGLDAPETADAARAGLLRAGPRALPWVRRVLEDSPTLGIIEVAGQLGDSSVVPPLVAIATTEAAPLRVAAARALGAIGDGRAAPALRSLLTMPDPTLVEAAVRALGEVGSPADAEALQALLAESPPSQERAVLEALLRIAPEAGREAIVARITADDPASVRRATEAALAHPHPQLAAVFHGLFQHDVRRPQAASALAELADGAGIPALLAEVERREELSDGAREDLTRALAVALHRWGRRGSGSLAEEASRQLRVALGEGAEAPRGLVLRALARDPAATEGLVDALAADDVATRAWAAQGLALVEDPVADRAIAARLADEDELDVLRALLGAARARRLSLPDAVLEPLLRRPELGPAPLLVLRGPQPDERRAALRRSLRRSDSPERVAAALALAATGDRAAWRALVERLDQDDDPTVRRACADALAALAVPAAREALRRRARIEGDPRVRGALEAAARGLRRPLPRGRGVLRFAVRAAGAPSGVPVRVTLPTGAIWTLRTLSTGEVFIAGQPAGAADVRVLLEDGGL
jgi:HEAT repeat protein